ncbi:dormancy-associated protein homolog 3 isoform X1 [Tripterygium wilfordii]|uniref:dormancy-associated protein homolog 3 isoform X1 n=1 Tax=Tripterygium wilfordii TaxID=458696 RepID=UPI0018F833CF|nr:dormancy-associated protein homolog 3 isoform X1 [Tripterygium wilfordii]
MGLLDQLWDDTVAGPRPENGLGKLRKHNTFSFRSSSGKEPDGANMRSYGDEASEEATKVTRSIMIVKPPGYQTGSPPVSPAGSTPPVSPFSGSRESFRFRRKSASDAYEKAREVGPRSPSSPYNV